MIYTNFFVIQIVSLFVQFLIDDCIFILLQWVLKYSKFKENKYDHHTKGGSDNMQAANYIVKALEDSGVDTIFGYPGGAVLPLYEALRKSKIKHYLSSHEQCATHSASGYARATGKTGVCLVTSGPGATNAITGIATAYADSIPLVVISGQVPTYAIGKDVFQEADIIGASEPFTKHNHLVQDANELPEVIRRAFHIAGTGRPGPVLIDIPSDIQKNMISSSAMSLGDLNIPGYKPVTYGHPKQIKKALHVLQTSRKPLIVVGGGIMRADACESLLSFVEKSGIPVAHTMMGKGAIAEDHPYALGMIGGHGHSRARKAIEEADAIMIIGARISNRAVIGLDLEHKDKSLIHIDVDPAEVGKNLNTHIPVVGDATKILEEMTKQLDQSKALKWFDQIEQVTYSKQYSSEAFTPIEIMEILDENISDNAIITTDVGQHQIWTARHLPVRGSRRFFTSGGLGTMGYGLPCAIGAAVAKGHKRQIVCITGDGSIQMNLSELGVAKGTNQPILFILLNNSRLGMVRELQDRAYGADSNFGVHLNNNPDFTLIAKAYNLIAHKVTNTNDLRSAIDAYNNKPEATLIECVLEPNLNTIWG